MQKIFLLLVILGSSFYPTFSKSGVPDSNKNSGMSWGTMDEEYERYKKRADEFFDRGDYQNALRQYRNCLEVPTYENDPYAKGRIALVEKLVKLRQEGYQSLNAGKGEMAVGFFEQIVAENPKDSITKVNLTDYWTGEATKSYAQQQYEQAKSQYQQALKYATKPALIEMQIQNSEAFIKMKAEQVAKTVEPTTKREAELVKGTNTSPKVPLDGSGQPGEIVRKEYTGLKILTAAVGVGAGAYAYTLNNQYQAKLDEANRMGKSADPDGDNVILTPGEFNQWQTAYQATTAAKQNRSKFVASLGVVGVAAITEVILMVLPKSKKPTGLRVGANTQQIGVAVRYTFR